MPRPGSIALICGSGARVGAASGADCARGSGDGTGTGTTGGTNSNTVVCARRRRHHSPANPAASKAAAPAAHGQIEPNEDAGAAGSVKLAVGAAMLLGCGRGVTGWVVGPGAVLAAGWSAVVVRGSGAGARAGPVMRGDGAAVTGALGTWVGLAEGTGVGTGLGRGTAVRIIGASLSTGPCARGLLVGRPLGIEKSGIVWPGASAGVSNSPSATAPAAALALPPNFCINRSIS